MRQQTHAKKFQCYEEKPKPRTCGNCSSYSSTFKLTEWMNVDNRVSEELGISFRYKIENGDGEERNKRCKRGGFAVKKTATCDYFCSMNAPPPNKQGAINHA